MKRCEAMPTAVQVSVEGTTGNLHVGLLGFRRRTRGCDIQAWQRS